MENLAKRIDQLEKRNEVLEKHHRRMNSFLFILMILVCWSIVHLIKHSFWPDPFEASRLVIEDPDSNAGVELDAHGFVFWDQEGVSRIILSTDQSGPRLGFLDEKGKWRLSLGQASEGPSFSMLDENEKWRVQMYQDSESCRLFFCDDEGKPGCDLSLGTSGPGLNMWKGGRLVFEAPSE